MQSVYIAAVCTCYISVYITRQPRSPQRSMWVYCAAQGMLQELLDPSPLKNKTQHCKWERGVGLAGQTTFEQSLHLSD